MNMHRKLIQFAAVAALVAALPAQAQVLGGNLGGNIGGTLGGSLGTLSGSGAANGTGQGTFDAAGPVGTIRDTGDRAGSRIRSGAGSVKDKAEAGATKANEAGSGSLAASHEAAAKAEKKTAEKGSEPAPSAPSPGLLDGFDGSAAEDGAVNGSAQKDVMGRSIMADGSSTHSNRADRSGVATSGSHQANVKADRHEAAAATPASEEAPAN